MAMFVIHRRDLSRMIRRGIIQAIARSGVDHLLVAQAKRRIDNGGDSEVRYPALSTRGVLARSYRAGGQPLLDTRQHVYNRLSGAVRTSGRSVTFLLRGPLTAIYHHYGFKTRGPNFVPLTRKAARTHRKGADPSAEGLLRGIDYVMFWRGVTVPARPIMRLPPEDRAEIDDAITGSVARWAAAQGR